MAQTSLSLHFPSTSSEVRRALGKICDHAEANGSKGETLGRLEIVLAEVLNNVVEHALRNEENGDIHLTTKRLAGGWRFDIYDNGVPMPGNIIPTTTLPTTNRPRRDLPEGGFGWAIVHMLAHDLSYRRKDGGNHLAFVIPET